MDFKARYVQELRDKDPGLFRELVKTKQIDQYLQAKSAEAHGLLAQLVASEPKGPDGLPRDPQALRLAEERVWAQMLDFPSTDPSQKEPPEDLPTQTSKGRITALRAVK